MHAQISSWKDSVSLIQFLAQGSYSFRSMLGAERSECNPKFVFRGFNCRSALQCRLDQGSTPYGEYSSPWIKCVISAGWGQNGGTCSADLNRLTDEFWMLGGKGPD